MSKIIFSDFSGMTPKIDRFARPPGVAETCNNVVFHRGGLTPFTKADFLANGTVQEGGDLTNSEIQPPLEWMYNDSLYWLAPEATTLPPVNLVSEVTGTQNVFVMAQFSDGSWDEVQKGTASLGQAKIQYNKTGFTVSLAPSAYNSPVDWYTGVIGVKVLGITNQIDINSESLSVKNDPTFTDPLFSRGTIEVDSIYPEGNTTFKSFISISGGVQDFHSEDFSGGRAGDLLTSDISCEVFLNLDVKHEYDYSGMFRYKYSILDSRGEIAYTSPESELVVMDPGNGLTFGVPLLQRKYNEGGGPYTGPVEYLDGSRYRVYRSMNFGPFVEIDVNLNTSLSESNLALDLYEPIPKTSGALYFNDIDDTIPRPTLGTTAPTSTSGVDSSIPDLINIGDPSHYNVLYMPSGFYVAYNSDSPSSKLYISKPGNSAEWPTHYAKTLNGSILFAFEHYGKLVVFTTISTYVFGGGVPHPMRGFEIKEFGPVLDYRTVIPVKVGLTYLTDDGIISISSESINTLTRSGFYPSDLIGNHLGIDDSTSTIKSQSSDGLVLISADDKYMMFSEDDVVNSFSLMNDAPSSFISSPLQIKKPLSIRYLKVDGIQDGATVKIKLTNYDVNAVPVKSEEITAIIGDIIPINYGSVLRNHYVVMEVEWIDDVTITSVNFGSSPDELR